ncbi:cytochrome c biogenesis protein ResB [Nocardioides mangrovicus]|uniref:Cytochrome c biogenesis protein ResB n=1 Tax=Nocardioides mangrovicus TaxID=2478913 RepID=A0A3L8P798_9ACTN|nr:cytochrome c biogenesis protein ResB [Nocardioides mangrovicus]RLV50499.1 cytochrome c biogenesis protein ResB [Nocardioides mangrovicus]
MTLTSTRPETPPSEPPDLRPRELLRWAWRQLTSMRTALILLFLLALAAIPGSVVPQNGVDSLRASQWREQHKTLAPIYERLGLFDVYGSPWFAAIYLLLVVSLVGCILPRTMVYWRAARATPPPAPRRLTRLPEHRTFTTTVSPEDVLDRARRQLRRRRYRLAPQEEGTVAAERGYLREAGNLLFHVAVLVVIIGFGLGSLLGFKGGVIVVTGDGFSNQLSQYDDFTPGTIFKPSQLEPFSFTVHDFHVDFIKTGRSAGAAHKFYADLDVRKSSGSSSTRERISVNHPLTVDGTKVFLIGHGYAPHITVRDAEGNVAASGPAVFLPENESFTSFGVVKAFDAQPTAIGLEGEFYPTYAFSNTTGPFSAFPDDEDPALSMLVWRGKTGTDPGSNQSSVYALDKGDLTPLKTSKGVQQRIDLKRGQTVQLADGAGSVTFDGVSRFVRLQVSDRPGSGTALVGTVLALLGLLGSLFVRPRRVWVRVSDAGDGRTLVEAAGLDRSSGGDLSGELDDVVTGMQEST